MTRKLHGMSHLLRFDNRWQLIFSRLFPGSNQLLVYRLKGMSFVIDHASDDENGTRMALASDMYRCFLEQVALPTRPNVLDLGANGGGLGLLVQALGHPIGKIVAVEMNPRTAQRLRFNLERNVSGEVVVLNSAVCGKPRTFELVLGAGGTSDSIYGASNGGAIKTRVEGRGFDDIADQHFSDQIIDLCKIDIEGAEHEVFSNPGHSRIKSCRYLVMEIHPTDEGDASTKRLLDHLIELGFKRRQERSSEPDVYFFENSTPAAQAQA